jgi:hypothetical protein
MYLMLALKGGTHGLTQRVGKGGPWLTQIFSKNVFTHYG